MTKAGTSPLTASSVHADFLCENPLSLCWDGAGRAGAVMALGRAYAEGNRVGRGRGSGVRGRELGWGLGATSCAWVSQILVCRYDGIGLSKMVWGPHQDPLWGTGPPRTLYPP